MFCRTKSVVIITRLIKMNHIGMKEDQFSIFLKAAFFSFRYALILQNLQHSLVDCAEKWIS